MRRIFILILCLFLLTTTVSAAGIVNSMQSNTIVDADGTCQVSLTMQLTLDSADKDLYFPLPSTARDVSLNGKGVRSPLRSGYRVVDLSDAVPGAGVYTVTLQYSLPDSVILDKDDQLILQFDLLSGFAYPIQAMSFTITLPGAPEHRPTFFSTYYQETADSLMNLTIEGNQISATIHQPLKDQEALTLSLVVSEDMFPQSVAKRWKMSTNDVLMIALAILAFAYWLLTMGSLPPRRNRKAQEPEGLTAGELGCCLTGQGLDFTMLVVSWAQLGYLMIQLQENGRVLLHKRMDMGNERSDFEVRYFKTLFGKRNTVDGTGFHYARLCQKASVAKPHLNDYYQRRSGNPRILSVICLAIGFLGGTSLALAFANDTIWQIVLSILLVPLTTVFSWIIQSGAKAIHLRRKQLLWLGLLASLLWMLLGLWAGEGLVVLLIIAVEWLCGLATAYTGRRSEIGRLYMADILGLRQHLRRISTYELQWILQQNPDYYYAMAPYAMALGVDRAFARQVGKMRLPQCTYMTTGMDGHTTAKEWNELLREAVQVMDERQQRLLWERFFGK
jgi:hypothetical protein